MSPTRCNWVVVGSGVLDGPELPKAIKMITAARLGPSGRPVPTRGNWVIVGGEAHIAPLTIFNNRTHRVDVGIDPYNIKIGAEGSKNYGENVGRCHSRCNRQNSGRF